MIKCDGAMDRCTLISMKLATIAFVIVVLKLWGGAMTWVVNTNIWWFVVAFVIFAVKAGMNCPCCSTQPAKKVAKKKK